jgi:chromosome partitioning protein
VWQVTKVIAVANNKGGVAKTTTAGNLGYGLSRYLMKGGQIQGHVLMVDLDPQGNLSDFFGVRQRAEGKCIGNILDKPGDVDALKANVIKLDRDDDGLQRPNIFLIPASRELEFVTEELTMRQLSQRHKGFDISMALSDALAPLVGRFRYVVIDCPPKLDVLKRAVYNFADDVIVPVKADYMSFQGAQQHTNDLRTLRDEYGDKIKARLRFVLPTMVQPRQVLAREVMEAMISLYGRGYVADPIPESVDVKESPARGQSLFEYAPQSVPAVAYGKLVGRVANVR